MRLDKFTVKAQEALQAAQSKADQHNHQAIEPEHLLGALLEQREGVVGPVLAKLGARPEAIQRELDAALGKLPSVKGASGQYLGERTRQALERAQAEAERLKDEYVSTEHLLLALAQERDGAAGRVLTAAGVSAEAIYKALVEVRGTPIRIPRRSIRRSSAIPATSPTSPGGASSTRSSAATRRSGG